MSRAREVPKRVGVVGELWRYPVKSMVGERVDEAAIESRGLVGDRCWALRDEGAGELTVVRKTPKLLACSAEYVSEPRSGGPIEPVVITFPDGVRMRSSDASIDRKISDVVGKRVSLWPLQPRSNWRHYRTSGVMDTREIKRLFASDDVPDLSSVSWRMLLELAVFTTPLGSYHDVYPLHVLTTGSLRKLAELEPESDVGAHRFRPNLVIDTEATRLEEFSWVGGTLHIGETIIRCESRTVRCLMPAQPQVDKPKDARILRALNEHTGRHFGINASVIRHGRIRCGDEVLFRAHPQSVLGAMLDRASVRAKNAFVRGSLRAAELTKK